MVRLLIDDQWPSDVNLWMVPCLNPGGFEKSTRENEDGVDLNRDYKSQASLFRIGSQLMSMFGIENRIEKR